MYASFTGSHFDPASSTSWNLRDHFVVRIFARVLLAYRVSRVRKRESSALLTV
jgi:hypothetical protein